jgi:hypothetical protein
MILLNQDVEKYLTDFLRLFINAYGTHTVFFGVLSSFYQQHPSYLDTDLLSFTPCNIGSINLCFGELTASIFRTEVSKSVNGKSDRKSGVTGTGKKIGQLSTGERSEQAYREQRRGRQVPDKGLELLFSGPITPLFLYNFSFSSFDPSALKTEVGSSSKTMVNTAN